NVGVWLGGSWEYDGTTWTPIVAPNAPSTVGGMLAFDMDRGRMVMFTSFGDTWELLPAASPTWTRHGLGCPGSAGTPGLGALQNASPALGGTFTLQLTSLPAQPG